MSSRPELSARDRTHFVEVKPRAPTTYTTRSSSSPPSSTMTAAERAALQPFRAARASEDYRMSPTHRSESQLPRQNSEPIRQNQYTQDWLASQGHPTTPPSPHVGLYPPLKSQPTPPYSRDGQSPPTLQTYERSFTPPPDRRKPVSAMPGTMSSRPTAEAAAAKSRKRPGRRERSKTNVDKTQDDQPSPLGRLKFALMDMFRKGPVDSNSFERIQDRHWSDE